MAFGSRPLYNGRFETVGVISRNTFFSPRRVMASKFLTSATSTTTTPVVPIHESVFKTMQYFLPVPHEQRLSWNVVVCADGAPIHFDLSSSYDGVHLDCFYEVPLDALLSWMERMKKFEERGELAYLCGVCGLRRNPASTGDFDRYTVDYVHYLDNLRVPLKTSVRGGEVYDESPMACHVHAVRRMYPLLRDPHEVRWAVQELYQLVDRDNDIGCTDKYRLRILPAMEEYRKEMGNGGGESLCYARMAAVVDIMDLMLDVRNVGCDEDHCIQCKPNWDKTIYDANHPQQYRLGNLLVGGERDRNSFLSYLDRKLYCIDKSTSSGRT